MKQIEFNTLRNDVFIYILSFADPQSISNLVLTSRQMRLHVGEVIKEVLKQQQEFYKYSLMKKSNYKKIMANYYKILKQITCFSSQEVYKKFIDQMNEQNALYYRNFFSTVLGKEIKIDSQSIKSQKQGLKEIGNNIYQLLQQLKSTKVIPKFKVQYLQFNDYSINKTQKIFQFINQFTRELSILQQIPNIRYLQQDFTLTKTYLLQYKYITKIKLQPELYQTKLYYLRKDLSYHQFINFNINSIILSFLKVSEIQALSQCDHIFRGIIPQIIHIIFQNLMKYEDQLLENINQRGELAELSEQYNLMQRYSQAKLEIQYIRFLQRANMQIETINVLYKLLNIKEQDQLQFISKFLSKLNCGICLYPYTIQLNEEQIKILEDYFEKNNSIRNIEIISVGHALIHVNLQVSLKMKQFNLTEQDIWNYQREIYKLKKINLHNMNLLHAINIQSIQSNLISILK